MNSTEWLYKGAATALTYDVTIRRAPLEYQTTSMMLTDTEHHRDIYATLQMVQGANGKF